jgi:RNA polymerase sigma-70 factor (ECF subfamily)
MHKDEGLHKIISGLQQRIADDNDVQSFEQLYLVMFNPLHQFAYRIIKSNHIAEEIVSDVFVMIWKKKEGLAQIENLKVFLYVAVKNQALTYLYKSKKQKIDWIDEFAGNDQLISSLPRPVELLEAKEISEKINKAVNNLPLKCKAVFRLVKEDGLKYHEAAKLLNLSVKTIENQMGISFKKIALALEMDHYTK